MKSHVDRSRVRGRCQPVVALCAQGLNPTVGRDHEAEPRSHSPEEPEVGDVTDALMGSSSRIDKEASSHHRIPQNLFYLRYHYL